MGNTKPMGHVFRHPDYYKKLKASLKKEAISPDPATAESGRAPEATSFKQQAASLKHLPRYVASDYKATSIKRQALKEIPPN